MKPRLMSRIRMPYGGLYYIEDPLTKKPLEGTTFEMLYNRAVAYRRSNSIPIGLDFEEEIEAQVCQRYPQECEVSKRSMGVATIAPGLWDVVRGSQIMMQHRINGAELVSQEEANRRAEICYRCPMRAQMTLPCSRCTGVLENIVNVITGSHGTPFDEKLSACSVCKCYISASVWMPLDTQCIGVTDEQREKFGFAKEFFNCWKTC
jgi:hypothetical protein